MNPPRRLSNVGASVRARLQNYSRERKVEFQRVLSDFAIERWLYRLGASRHAERFVLKGAMLFRLWSEDRRRATWDLDLLGRDASDVTGVMAVVEEVCALSSNDGIAFDVASIRGERIRAAEGFAGVRVRLEARLAGARIPMQIDVGFGNAVTPAPRRETYPTVLDHEAPTVLAYPREAVVAEKLEAMISLGVTNSRMKDFYDMYVLSASFAFDGPVLADAIRATFERRSNHVPGDQPFVLTDEFLGAPERQMMWKAFLRRGRLTGPQNAADLSKALREFLVPVIKAVARGEDFEAFWSPGGPWESPSERSHSVSEPLAAYGVSSQGYEERGTVPWSMVAPRRRRPSELRTSPLARRRSPTATTPARPGTL